MGDETQYPVCSEIVEPAMAHIMSRLWMQVEEEIEKNRGLTYIEDACCTLWWRMKTINKLTTACSSKRPGAVHFDLAAASTERTIAKYIKKTCGFDPMVDKEHPTVKGWYQTFRSIL